MCNNKNMRPLRFYAVAENWTNGEGPNAEAVLDQILFDADSNTWERIHVEATRDERPTHDALVKQAEDEIFSTWAKRPTSGHSLRIAWDQK